jgi:hypothetical protein
MSKPAKSRDGLGEIDFDVTKPPEGVKFVGLLDNAGQPGRHLTGLFDWECSKCAAWNRDVAMIEPEQAFLSRWFCRGCGTAQVVRFRARPSVEWVAGHTLAVTGTALCQLAETESGAHLSGKSGKKRRKGGQGAFAWIAVPALVALLWFGLSDMHRLSDPATASALTSSVSGKSGLMPRLRGEWVKGADRLCFIYVDEASRSGTYVYFPEGRRPGHCVRFDVVGEDVEEEQLIIRPRSETTSRGASNAGQGVRVSEATLHISEEGTSLTWIEIHEGAPILEVYNRVDDTPGQASPKR